MRYAREKREIYVGVWFGTQRNSHLAGINEKVVLKWVLNKMERRLPDSSGLGQGYDCPNLVLNLRILPNASKFLIS
jgi:hypothetical protein